MADIFSGYKRSLKCYVSKKLNGVVDVGYPKQYPTATDIANGYFTYNSVQYDIPTSEELSTMSQSAYDSLLATFKLYVEAAEAGASFATDTIVQPTIYDPSGCAVDPPTTTTTTTTILTPDMTYSIVADGTGYGNTLTTYTISGAQVGDIVTVNIIFGGQINLDNGYSSAIAKIYILYPNGNANGLDDCHSDDAVYSFYIDKTISFIAPSESFTITTDATKVNSSEVYAELSCAVVNVNRDSVDYPMFERVFGSHYKSLISQFSC